ncbi:MFS transporter, SP family, solute carrier family 2 (myo-inositol transporter), member 13 [Cryptococcus neoformans var. grubii Br795]|nr:MFS transporter, SP family, solute carrier family 2 (myo-inositol transporter), member 13 [Cryptococcus neoformans var. grubii 125.91]OXG71340.1 MFS transporter, SP family, solute carrier family 2 (myo-inositol transporter), member 13 [Cryptococcus neoformans var. grubii Br795]OXG77484.1 MFS transporter, SP family, solute carrier family 2 (myo-inositol transporter), member 13 [Cryptococcus neoformans var. grubii D17-1]OXG98349.1 MFS transporter, SP family, solute carrier family 2 (myo-inosito
MSKQPPLCRGNSLSRTGQRSTGLTSLIEGHSSPSSVCKLSVILQDTTPCFTTAATIFGLLGMNNGAAARLIPSAGNALFLFIGMSLVDRVGRRKLMIRICPGMFIGLV